jgi:hypothetical protein
MNNLKKSNSYDTEQNTHLPKAKRRSALAASAFLEAMGIPPGKLLSRTKAGDTVNVAMRRQSVTVNSGGTAEIFFRPD